MSKAVASAANPAMTAFEAAKDLVKAYLSANPMPAERVPDFLAEVHASMLRMVGNAAPAQASAPSQALPPRPVPAVPVEASVTDDHIVCLEDGTRHQMMKRYLKRVHGLSPDEYRARWGLPQDYPMTAPGYSARKRAEAFAVGLGTHENKRGANAWRLVGA